MRALLLVIAMLCLLPASATAQQNGASCERLTNDDAYNRCLAGFGPRRGQAARQSGVRAPRTSFRRGRVASEFAITPLRGGRMRLEIMRPRRR